MKKKVKKVAKIVKKSKVKTVKKTSKKHISGKKTAWEKGEAGFSKPKKIKLKAPAHKGPDNYLKTGIWGFDELFSEGYGVPSGASVLVEGGPGSGKTIFCLAAINGLCSQGKKCLYMSFEEPELRLLEHMRHFGWDVDTYVKKGLLKVKRFDALDVSRSVEALLSAAKKELLIEVDPVLFPKDFSPDFVVIDSLSSIASAFSGQKSRFRIYMEQLFRYLEKNEITNFLIREVSAPTHVGTTFKEQGEAVSFLSDGIVVLYNVIYDSGERTTAIEILKMRGVSFDKKIVNMKIINGKGVEINPDKVLKKDEWTNFELT